MSVSDSFEALHQASRQRVYDRLFALTGDAAEAQGVAQEAYARVWQRRATVGEYGNPEAWVRTVARRMRGHRASAQLLAVDLAKEECYARSA